MVINIGALKSGMLDAVREDIARVSDACHEAGAAHKGIIETALLTDDEKVIACQPARRAKAGKAKIFKVTSALWTLGSAKALAVGEEKPKDWGKYGLDDKARYIALFGEDGKELGRFVIGKPVPETPSGFYVRGSRDQVLQSDGSRFGEFPFRVEDVIDEPSVDGG